MFLFIKIHIKAFLSWKAILLFFFSFLPDQVFTQSYDFRNFNTEDGLAQSFIYSIIQDVHGYLWVGTDNGLSRYNGFKFENFTTSDSLADNFITCSISDGEYLWFGHSNGRLSYFNGKKFHSVKMPQPDLSRITHFSESQDGHIWVSTYSDGLLKLDKKADVIVTKLRERVTHSLQQGRKDISTTDGMDIAFKKVKKKVSDLFSGDPEAFRGFMKTD